MRPATNNADLGNNALLAKPSTGDSSIDSQAFDQVFAEMSARKPSCRPSPQPARPTINGQHREAAVGGERAVLWIAAMLLLAGVFFWWGPAAASAKRDLPAGPPQKYVTKAIRDMQVGDWVLAENPELTDAERQFEEIDLAQWRKVCLRMHKPDGSTLDIDLLRPIEWLEANQVQPRATIDLDLAEMGAAGAAEVLWVGPCPKLAPKPSPTCRVVTGKFAHSSGEVLDLHIEGLPEPIGTTANHPFWSEDRQAFIEAGNLYKGEQLRTADGALLRVAACERHEGSTQVYNLETDVEHVYYVSTAGLLVHNQYVDDAAPNRDLQATRQRIAGQIEEVTRRRGLGTDPTGQWRVAEEQAALRLEQRVGQLRRDPSKAGDWIDSGGKVYDAVGPVPSQHFDLASFTRQIDKHLLKQGVDRIVVDLAGLSDTMRADVLRHIAELSDAQRAKIIVQF